MQTDTITLIVFALMMTSFFLDRNKMAFSSLAAIIVLIAFGCLDKKSALAAFASPTAITMASMFIVASGLGRTQMVNNISRLLYKITNGSYRKILFLYVSVTMLLGEFVPSTVATFCIVYPLVKDTSERLGISPSKMMYPLAVTAVSCSFLIEPIGPSATWFIIQNGYLESYGWAGDGLRMWSETLVLLPVGIMTALICVFVIPHFLPSSPETAIVGIDRKTMAQGKKLSPIREVLGYGVFIVVVILLMLGFTSWVVTLTGAIVLVLSGVLTENEAIEGMNAPTVLMYIGVSALGTALSETGAADSLASALASVLVGVRNGYLIGFAIYSVGFLMTSFLYNRAVSSVLVPLCVITCTSIGCDPRGPVILCTLANMSSLISPMSTAVVPLAMSTGGYKERTVFIAGMIPAILRGIIGTAIAMSLYPAF